MTGELQAADLSGEWSGRWESTRSGRGGPLRACFWQLDELHYRVRFRGRFLKIIPFRYQVTLDVTGHEDGKVLLAGRERLWLFGTFDYLAGVAAGQFNATYTSKRDNGIFTLTRVT
jgi:hypothetical protein